MTDSILLSFAQSDANKDKWVVDILRETKKGYDYLGCLRDSAAHNLYLQVTEGVDSNEHRKVV